MGLLVAVLKATINLMHKLAPVISEMLNKQLKEAHEPTILNWPDHQKGITTLERSKWTQKQLSELEASCENLLAEGGF